MTLRIEHKARLACLYAGAVWGLFWIPLRDLEEAGINAIWITSTYFLVPAICVLPILIYRWQHIVRGGLSMQLTVLSSGAALALYSASIVYTDVIRAIMLFYLMPVWSMLLARLVLGEQITLIRVLAMALAMLGLLTLFGLGIRFPVPENPGDWIGLTAGIVWAFTMVRVRLFERAHASIDLTIGFFIWGFIISAAIALLLAPTQMPSIDQTRPVVPMLVVFMVLLVIPGTYASLWGPKYLNPGVAGLLFMTEIVVGAISVSVLTDEPFTLREFAGVALITGAGLLEPAWSLRKGQTV